MMSGLKGRNPSPVSALTSVFIKFQKPLYTYPKITQVTFLKTRFNVLYFRPKNRPKRPSYHQVTATTINNRKTVSKLLTPKHMQKHTFNHSKTSNPINYHAILINHHPMHVNYNFADLET